MTGAIIVFTVMLLAWPIVQLVREYRAIQRIIYK